VREDADDLDAAIKECQEAIRLDPKYAQAHKNLGRLWAEENKLDEAIKEFKAAIQLDPKEAEAHYNLGLVWEDEYELDKAIKEYRAAILLAPNSAEMTVMGAQLTAAVHSWSSWHRDTQ